jgi:hypothetical protein
VSTAVDRNNCGECGTICSPTADCVDGACVEQDACEGGRALCDGECVDTDRR